MNLLKFKEVKENELNIILDIYNYYIKNFTTTFDYDAVSLDEFKTRIFVNHNKYKTYLVYEKKELVGFCFLTQYRKKKAYDDTAEIGLYLKPQFVGKGLGNVIINYLERVAIKKRIRVIIASISGENIISIKLFKKLGYDQCAHYKGIAVKFNRKMDIIDFQKNLS